jgi:hypothetical protein
MRTKAAWVDIRRRFAGRLLIYVKRFSWPNDSHAVFADALLVAFPRRLPDGFVGRPGCG